MLAVPSRLELERGVGYIEMAGQAAVEPIQDGAAVGIRVVFDHHVANGINPDEFSVEGSYLPGLAYRFNAAAFRRDKSEAVATDDGVRLNDYPVSKAAAVAYPHPSVQ